jgi:large subunit ribosomal protein L6
LRDGIITVKEKMVNLQEFSDVTVTVEDGIVQVDRSSDHKDQEQKHGLYRSLINNMILV